MASGFEPMREVRQQGEAAARKQGAEAQAKGTPPPEVKGGSWIRRVLAKLRGS